jgi:hypothetical protein
MRILVAGRFASPSNQGGATWAILQYALGFSEMGHDVMLVDPCQAEPVTIAYHELVIREVPQLGPAILLHPDRTATGADYRELVQWAERADIVVNLGGVLRDREILDRVPYRMYVDLDPGFTQIWHATHGIDMGFSAHDRFFTVGGLLGTNACSLPTCGIEWEAILPPVVLSLWPRNPLQPRHGLTTVANWRSYGCVQHAGTHLGQKAHSIRRLAALPARVPQIGFEPALAIDPTETSDLMMLRRYGWRWVDAGPACGSPQSFQSFVATSTAELGIAKTGYVDATTGWFSDRSACYLAAGRPVVAQDTGWTALLPHGQGLHAFSDLDDAQEAIERVLLDYRQQCRMARTMACELFSAERVLTRMLSRDSVPFGRSGIR